MAMATAMQFQVKAGGGPPASFASKCQGCGDFSNGSSLIERIKQAARPPVITPQRRRTILDLTRRLAHDGWQGPAVRVAIDEYLGFPLTAVPSLESECRNTFFRWQRRSEQRRAGNR